MKNKLIKTKQDIFWNVMRLYLYGISHYGICYKDKEFNRLYKELCEYVSKKVALPTDDDVIDSYVLVIQQASNT